MSRTLKANTIIPGPHRSDHYVILNFIAAGGYGAVYKAKHIRTSDIVAIKIMQWEKLRDEYKRILREVIILQQVRHPNVICCLDMFLIPRSGGSGEEFDLAIVMPYVPCILSYEVDAANPRWNEINFVSKLYYLLRGIDYYHKCGLIHRDLSHRNVLVSHVSPASQTFDLFVADFGLSRQTAPQNTEQTFYVTTRAYRAPEVIASQKHYTTKVDIWAIGCILAYQLLGSALFNLPSSFDPTTRRRTPDGVGQQILSVLRIVGAPTAVDMQDFDEQARLFLSDESIQCLPSRLEHELRTNCTIPFPEGVLDEIIALIQKCLAIGPSRRPTAEEILATFPLFKKHNLVDPKQVGTPCSLPDVSTLGFPEFVSILKDMCEKMRYSPFTSIATTTVAQGYSRQLEHFESMEHCMAIQEEILSEIRGLDMHIRSSDLTEDDRQDTLQQIFELTEMFSRLVRLTQQGNMAQFVSQGTVPTQDNDSPSGSDPTRLIPFHEETCSYGMAQEDEDTESFSS